MRRIPRLGFLNLALVSLYFAPIWAREALRILLVPDRAFEDRSHAAAAIWLREVFDLTLEGLMRVSGALAGLKLVIAAGLLAYLIEFARAVASDANRIRSPATARLLSSQSEWGSGRSRRFCLRTQPLSASRRRS